MAAAKPSLDTITTPPLIGPGINGPAPTGKPDPNGPLIGPAGSTPDSTGPSLAPTKGDVLIGSAGAVSGVTADGVRGAVLDAIKDGPTTGPGAAEPGLLRWLEDSKIEGFSRTGGVAALVGMVPAIASDMHSEPGKPGNSFAEAATREGTGAALGLAAGGWAGGAIAGSELGATIGSVVPGAGTAVGLVVGAAVGGLVSYGASKGIEAAWGPVTDAVSSTAHSVESFFSFG